MTIETTINISMKNKIIIEKSAEKLQISKSEIIKRLFVLFINQNFENFPDLKRVQYQKKKPDEIWKPIHVWFSPEFYDKCQDLRRFHKLLISYILTLAILLYRNKILEGEHDNYHHNYVFIAFKHNHCPILIITWDYPGNTMVEKILQLRGNT